MEKLLWRLWKRLKRSCFTLVLSTPSCWPLFTHSARLSIQAGCRPCRWYIHASDFRSFVRAELIFVFGQARFRAQASHSFYRVNFHFLYAIHRVGRIQIKRRLGFDCASRFHLCVCPLRCYCRNLQISHGRQGQCGNKGWRIQVDILIKRRQG